MQLFVLVITFASCTIGADYTGQREKCPGTRGTTRAKVSFCSDTVLPALGQIVLLKSISHKFNFFHAQQMVKCFSQLKQLKIHKNAFPAGFCNAPDPVWSYDTPKPLSWLQRGHHSL